MPSVACQNLQLRGTSNSLRTCKLASRGCCQGVHTTGCACCPAHVSITGCYRESSCLIYTYMLIRSDKFAYVLIISYSAVPCSKQIGSLCVRALSAVQARARKYAVDRQKHSTTTDAAPQTIYTLSMSYYTLHKLGQITAVGKSNPMSAACLPSL